MIGVRSHEAKKIMKEKMKLGDKVRFPCPCPGSTHCIPAGADDRFCSTIVIVKNQVSPLSIILYYRCSAYLEACTL